MRVVWLAWYICGVCLLLALMASAITYHPDIQHLGVVLPAAFGGVALLAVGAAVGLGRLPPTHHAHQSRRRKRDGSDIAKSGNFSACPYCQ